MAAKKFIVKPIKVILCMLALIGNDALFAQSQITFQQISVKDGLSQNSAISITQDSTGYLWIATQDGLNKYDGRKFTKYPFTFVDITKSDYSNLGKVYTDRQGRLWIIPIDKVPYRYDPASAIFNPLAGIDDASVLFQDKDLNLWIGTYSKGLYCLKADTDVPVQVIGPAEITGTVSNITQKSSGNLLLAMEKEIVELDVQTHKAIHKAPLSLYGEPIATNFSAIVFDDAGKQWIGTFGDGLYFKDPDGDLLQRITQLPFTDPLPLDLNILDMFFDSKGRLWIATYGRGLYLVNFKQLVITNFNVDKHNPKALHYKDVLCIYEDASGTLWFGTDGAGISYYDEYLEKFNSLTNYQTPENISIDVVRAITVDQNDAIWIGTSGKGLTQYEPETNSWRTFTLENGTKGTTISSNRIMSLLVDNENHLWIGTQENGLDIYKSEDKFAHYSSGSRIALSASTVWAIFMDREDNTWLGTREQGLIQFDKTKGEIKKYVSQGDKGPPSDNIRTITEDNQGNLWIGTEADGIAKFNKNKEIFTSYHHIKNQNSLSNNNIKSVYHDPNGILWIGTNGGGLNAFDTAAQKFYSYTVDDGLANNVIYAVLPDDEGNLWLSSNKGISRFTKGNKLGDAPAIVNYNNYAGLATEFNTGAYYKDKKGQLYFGGLEGFYWFKPEAIQENRFLSKTVITDFQVSNEPYPTHRDIDLEHDQNTLSFTFSSLQYSLPEKNLFQYRLINYDDEWIHSGNNNFARYAFLTPGDYEFQVKSSNYDGAWNPQPATLAFTIVSPWYLTTIAKFLYIVLLIAIAFMVYRYLKWRWRLKLDLQLKEEEAERFKRLNDFKSKLFTDISHEIRTPLTLISGPVEAKLGEGNLSDSDFANFSMIKRNTNRLIALVDQLLHMAKLEKGKIKLTIEQGNLGIFLRALASSFEYRAELRNLDYSFKVTDMKNVWYDVDAIEKIVTNLLSNAIKYGAEKGMVVFNATESEGMVQISVQNTVTKSSEIQLDKLFGRFYQKDEYAEGAGVGLSMVKELVELYRGDVSVQMEAENIIHFMVRLPTERAFFGNEVIQGNTLKKEGPLSSAISEIIELHTPSPALDNEKEELPILLIVEDNREVRDFLSSVWKFKYKIFLAQNGKIGIEQALRIVPDLIITDVRMPICGGIELCNKLKTDERTSHIPIILLTAGMEEEDELKGLQSGADDFITKPFKLRILEKRVENLIDTRQALRSRYSQEVMLKAKDIAITPTDELFFKRMQKILDKHLSDTDFNAARFCKQLGMSRMQLHRKLLAFTGLSTTAFIRSQRLKQALHILQTSDATISEIAYTVGFNTPSYFIKCFKEIYKKTPSDYLQSTDIP